MAAKCERTLPLFTVADDLPRPRHVHHRQRDGDRHRLRDVPRRGAGRLVTLESMRLIAGRQDKADGKPRRVYAITDEGWRNAEMAG